MENRTTFGRQRQATMRFSLAEDAVWRAVTRGVDGGVRTLLEGMKTKFTANALAKLVNTVRPLVGDEIREVKESRHFASLMNTLQPSEEEEDTSGIYPPKVGVTTNFSILFIAVCRNLHMDVEYLIQQPKVALDIQCGDSERTALSEAVARKDPSIVSKILRCPSVSPSQYINIGDFDGNTPLHQVACNCRNDRHEIIREQEKNHEETRKDLDILHELLLHGANIDTPNHLFLTPLHMLIRDGFGKQTLSCVDALLDAGAEVNTKDDEGNSPLHDACKRGDHNLINKLLDCGADPDSLNLHWQTPQDLFREKRNQMLPDQDESTINRLSGLRKDKMSLARKRVGIVPKDPARCPDEMRRICSEFPVYFRYQWPGLDPQPDGSTTMSWVRSDMKVAQILYPQEDDNEGFLSEKINGGKSFLNACEARFAELIRQHCSDGERGNQEELRDQETGEPEEKKVQDDIKKNSWRWINFPSNNMTWIQDFIINNIRHSGREEVDRRTWHFFEHSIRVKETNASDSRVRIPHVQVTEKSDPGDPRSTKKSAMKWPAQTDLKEKSGDLESAFEQISSWSNSDGFLKPGSMLSLVIPFLDIETKDKSDLYSTQCERIDKLNQAYSPFTGMHGVQLAQTLDQTSYNIEPHNNDLRGAKNQVIYRWSKREGKKFKLSQEHIQQQDEPDIIPQRTGRGRELLKGIWHYVWNSAQPKQSQQRDVSPGNQHQNLEFVPLERAGKKSASATNAERVRRDPARKWLMVRQLWLWKLDDNTVVTSIPSRRNGMKADTLLETIRQGNLDTIRTANDLIKRIIYEAASFPDEFKWAGLGEHVLDIFEGEIAFQTDQEADFFQRFTKRDWSSKLVNSTIQEAAESTWIVKDIRDELRLVRQVFETQLKVVQDFAEIFWPSKRIGKSSQEKDSRKALRESFIRDSGLKSMIERVKRMDEDASTTLQGLSNIIQAMQAQASLKEAEAGRVMNLIILPFTIVTVIFTPLSFLTSLFAVNSLGFPHNDDGELRLPSSWFTWRMVVGEIGSLVPIVLLVLVIYFRLAGSMDQRLQAKRVKNPDYQ